MTLEQDACIVKSENVQAKKILTVARSVMIIPVRY